LLQKEHGVEVAVEIGSPEIIRQVEHPRGFTELVDEALSTETCSDAEKGRSAAEPGPRDDEDASYRVRAPKRQVVRATTVRDVNPGPRLHNLRRLALQKANIALARPE